MYRYMARKERIGLPVEGRDIQIIRVIYQSLSFNGNTPIKLGMEEIFFRKTNPHILDCNAKMNGHEEWSAYSYIPTLIFDTVMYASIEEHNEFFIGSKDPASELVLLFRNHWYPTKQNALFCGRMMRMDLPVSGYIEL